MKQENSTDSSENEEQIENERRNARKLRRQSKNKLKKEDVKRGREEELRRKLCEPKDQRVRVVNQKELDLLLKDPRNDCSSTSGRLVPSNTSEEFPSLGKGRSKEKRHTVVVSPVGLGLNLLREETSSPSPVNEVPNSLSPEPSTYSEKMKVPFDTLSSPNLISKKAAVPELSKEPAKKQHSKPKRNDPIHIDVLTALKKLETPTIPERKGIPKKETLSRLQGNQMDSSNPERKKGKVREIPKVKKPSQLKRIIIKEREFKKLAKENSAISVSNDAIMSEQSDILGFPSLAETEDLSTSEEKSLMQLIRPSVNMFSGVNIGIGEIGNMTSDTNCLPETVTVDPFANTAKMSLHSRKFREYCDHSLSFKLDFVVSELVKDIVKFQDRLYNRDQVKAHAKKRFVLGFRETKKYLSLKKIKLLIIAPDLQRVQAEGGIDDIIDDLKEEASSQGVPYVFALNRNTLKKLTNKSFNVRGISCIGVLSYEGSEENFHAMQIMLPELRLQYAQKLEEVEQRFNQVQQLPSETGKTETDIAKPLLVEDATSEENPADVNREVVAAFLSKLVIELGKD